MKEEYKEFIRQHMCPVCYKPFTLTYNNSFGLKTITLEVNCKHKKEISELIQEYFK